jgi:hypothetical protein
MAEVTKTISEREQHHFIVDEKQNSDSQNREQEENGESGYNAIAKQIRYNVKDYIIAYSQCANIHYDQQREETILSPEVFTLVGESGIAKLADEYEQIALVLYDWT